MPVAWLAPGWLRHRRESRHPCREFLDIPLSWPPLDFRAKSNGMDAPAFNGISCAKVEVSSSHLIQQERPR
jgi:hypothetical protein